MTAKPRKFAYADSDKEALASKSQRNPSKSKEPTYLRRSKRLEGRSITKEKARRERSKPRGKRSGHQETSLDSEREEVDEMFERVKAFIKGEVATGSAEMVRPSQGDK
nr:hypothetical protein [Tanacetum cinerariifolium]